MARVIFPDMAESQDDGQQLAQDIFQDMIHKGNRVAEIRKAEFDFLERALDEFASRIRDRELGLLSWTAALDMPLQLDKTASTSDNATKVLPVNMPMTQGSTFFGTILDQPPSGMMDGTNELPQVNAFDFFDNTGISSDVFFNIVDQMGNSAFSTTTDGYT